LRGGSRKLPDTDDNQYQRPPLCQQRFYFGNGQDAEI